MVAFGSADFTAKLILRKVNVYKTVFLSQLIGVIPFLGIVIVFDHSVPDLSLLTLAIVSGGLSAVLLSCLYKALSLGKATLVMPICSCQTVVAVVLSLLVLGENLNVLQTLMIAGVFCGIVLVALEKSKELSISKVGILFALAVVLIGGAVTIFQKWIAASNHSLLGFLLIRLCMVAALAALFPVFKDSPRTAISHKDYGAIAFLGILETLAFFAMFMGFREGFVSIVSPIANSSAAITVILARIVLNERIVRHQKLGVIAIITCVAILSAIS